MPDWGKRRSKRQQQRQDNAPEGSQNEAAPPPAASRGADTHDALSRAIREWLAAPDWEVSRAYLRAHPALLAPDVAALLPDEEHRKLWNNVAQYGLDEGYERYLEAIERSNISPFREDGVETLLIVSEPPITTSSVKRRSMSERDQNTEDEPEEKPVSFIASGAGTSEYTSSAPDISHPDPLDQQAIQTPTQPDISWIRRLQQDQKHSTFERLYSPNPGVIISRTKVPNPWANDEMPSGEQPTGGDGKTDGSSANGRQSRLRQIPEITVGTRLTDYATIDLTVIGTVSGGMGLVVWGSDALQGGKYRAIKFVRPDRLASASREQRAAMLADFEQEALVATHLWPHAAIVHIDEMVQIPALDDLPSLVMEYLPEGSLRDKLQQMHGPGRSSTLSLDAVFSWALDIVAALDALHTRDSDHERPLPNVHCDIKPENMLIAANWSARILDYGLSRVWLLAHLGDENEQGKEDEASTYRILEMVRNLYGRADDSRFDQGSADDDLDGLRQTRAFVAGRDYPKSGQKAPDFHGATSIIVRMGSRGPVAGTPPYMPPEQWLGMEAVEPASDVYAFGVVLFELFAGVSGQASYPHQPDPQLTMTAGPFAAWCAAHASGPSRHLGDAEVKALSDGPLSQLLSGSDVSQKETALATAALEELDNLVSACLALDPEMRPTARQVHGRLGALADCLGLPSQPDARPRAHTPENETAFWHRLAKTYGAIGQAEEHLQLARRVVEMAPNKPEYWMDFALALSEQEHPEDEERWEAYEQALQACAKAEACIDRESDATVQYRLPFVRGKALLGLARHAEALVEFVHSLGGNPDQADVLYHLALAYWQRSIGASTTVEQKDLLLQALGALRLALENAPLYGDAAELSRIVEAELHTPDKPEGDA